MERTHHKTKSREIAKEKRSFLSFEVSLQYWIGAKGQKVEDLAVSHHKKSSLNPFIVNLEQKVDGLQKNKSREILLKKDKNAVFQGYQYLFKNWKKIEIEVPTISVGFIILQKTTPFKSFLMCTKV